MPSIKAKIRRKYAMSQPRRRKLKFPGKATSFQLKKIWEGLNSIEDPYLMDCIRAKLQEFDLNSIHEIDRWTANRILSILEDIQARHKKKTIGIQGTTGQETQELQPSQQSPVSKIPEVSSQAKPGQATEKQINFILSLFAELGWNDDHVRNWLLKYQKIAAVNQLTKAKGSGVITALLKIKHEIETKESLPPAILDLILELNVYLTDILPANQFTRRKFKKNQKKNGLEAYALEVKKSWESFIEANPLELASIDKGSKSQEEQVK